MGRIVGLILEESPKVEKPVEAQNAPEVETPEEETTKKKPVKRTAKK